MSPRRPLDVALSLGAGLAGALVARALGLPLPFLLGALVANAALAMAVSARSGRAMWFPQPLRMAFVAVIGAMIGTTFDTTLLASIPGLWVSLLAIMLFILLAEACGYALYRRLGGFDRPTALYAAMPGGLVEAVALGESAGADPARLGLQHFVRIVLVVVTVPALFYVFTGHAVGSAAGQSISRQPADAADWLGLAGLALAGGWLGRRVRLPAGHLTGPLLLVALLQGAGLVDLTGPGLLLDAAQLVVGAGLGLNFARATPAMLARGLALGILVVGLVLGLAFALAGLLAPVSPMSFEALFISFAPGGVTEMSLIALSLGVNPLLVAAHHLFRIMVTVSAAAWMARRLRAGPGET